jgi:hypothetical protein
VVELAVSARLVGHSFKKSQDGFVSFRVISWILVLSLKKTIHESTRNNNEEHADTEKFAEDEKAWPYSPKAQSTAASA